MSQWYSTNKSFIVPYESVTITPTENIMELSLEMQADLNTYYDWLEQATGEQELPEDQMA